MDENNKPSANGGITTICINGDLQVGDVVLSTPADDYACMVGTVLAINKLGSRAHDEETDNPTDDVHVNFMAFEYSEQRFLEITQMLGDLYGRPTMPGTLPPVDVDDVIMSPDVLIRITGIPEHELSRILDSYQNAADYCAGVEAQHPETPAEAALHEPEYYEDMETGTYRDMLIDRVNSNYTEYINGLYDKDDIADYSSEIAAISEAHYYITEIHNLHFSELDYLLKFQNPLLVVASEFDANRDDEHSDIMWKVFHEQYALTNGRHPLVSNDLTVDDPVPESYSEDTVKQKLFARLDTNLSDYCESLMETDKREIIGMAEDIASWYAAREYMKTAYDFKTGEVAFLLQFQDPLSLVAESWTGTLDRLVDMDFVMSEILETADSHGHFAKVMDASNPASKESARTTTEMEKPSVLAQIRKAAEMPKEPHKNKPARDKSEPVL